MTFSAIRRMTVTAVCAAMSGCAMVVLFSMEPDERASLFLVPADKAFIYFFRDEANDDAVPLALSIDGNATGEARPTRFQFYEVAPGHHVLASPGASSDSIELDTESGKAYFVGQQVGCDGVQLRLHLHAVEPAVGKARVKALYLAGKTAVVDEAHAAANSQTCRSADKNTGTTQL